MAAYQGLNPTVSMVVHRTFPLLASKNKHIDDVTEEDLEQDKQMFPRFPGGDFIELPEDQLVKYVSWINDAIKGRRYPPHVIVGCDSTGLKRDPRVVLFIYYKTKV